MFDPSKPAFGSPNSSAEMRGQLNGLKDLIDAVPTITSAVIDSVTTGNPGDPASVSASIISGVLHLSFSLPRGDPGQTGAQGPPFANAIVDNVTTLNAGDNATVSVSFDGNNVHFSFGIPRGNDGSQGIQGFQGPPGEVSNNDLNNALSAAISGTSSNSNAVSTLDTPFTDPDAEALRVAFNTLVNTLRR